MIRTIIFDLGGVVITLAPEEAERRFSALGITDIHTRLNSYTQSGIFGDLELGKIDSETFRREISALAGRDVSHDECRHAWLGYNGGLPQRNLDALLRLRNEGYRLILLSNTNPYMMSWAMSTDFDGHGHPITHYFDALYLSYKLGVMKPDENIFRHMLMTEKIFPYETLFLDDGPRNVAVASQIGINTYCPQNGADWTKDIYNYLRQETL